MRRWHIVAVGFLVFVGWSKSVRAEESPFPACNNKPTKGERAQAQEFYARGKLFRDSGEPEKAIEDWKRAYERDCSAFLVLRYIGDSYDMVGKKGEAADALEAYLLQANLKAVDSAPIETRIAKLRKEATAPVSVTPPPAPLAPKAAPAKPSPAPAQPTESDGNSRVGQIALTSVGGAALAAGVVVMISGLVKIGETNDACPNHACPNDEATAAGNAANARAITGGVIAGAGTLALGSGIIWMATSTSRAPKQPAKGSVHLHLHPGLGSIRLTGTF